MIDSWIGSAHVFWSNCQMTGRAAGNQTWTQLLNQVAQLQSQCRPISCRGLSAQKSHLGLLKIPKLRHKNSVNCLFKVCFQSSSSRLFWGVHNSWYRAFWSTENDRILEGLHKTFGEVHRKWETSEVGHLGVSLCLALLCLDSEDIHHQSLEQPHLVWLSLAARWTGSTWSGTSDLPLTESLAQFAQR